MPGYRTGTRTHSVTLEGSGTGTLTNPSAYVLDLHAQPVVKPDTVLATTRWNRGQPQTKRLTLGGDERLRFRIDGVAGIS